MALRYYNKTMNILDYIDIFHLKLVWQVLLIIIIALVFFKYNDIMFRIGLIIVVIGYSLSISGFFESFDAKEVPLWFSRIGYSIVLIRLATGMQIVLPKLTKGAK